MTVKPSALFAKGRRLMVNQQAVHPAITGSTPVALTPYAKALDAAIISVFRIHSVRSTPALRAARSIMDASLSCNRVGKTIRLESALRGLPRPRLDGFFIFHL
jgi:hypothetical protein